MHSFMYNCFQKQNPFLQESLKALLLLIPAEERSQFIIQDTFNETQTSDRLDHFIFEDSLLAANISSQ